MTEGYLKDISILLVDDNEFDSRLIANVLRAFGAYRITTAVDGAEGFEIFRRSPADIVMTDWMM